MNFEQSEMDIIEHMNSSHGESIKLYVTKLMKKLVSSQESKGDWDIVGIDPDGFDLRKKNIVVRFFLKNKLMMPKKLRGIFVSLHKQCI